MNTLVDTLKTRLDLGYTISGSTHQVNLLQYTDDTCLLANSPASCQYLLNIVDDWLQWSENASQSGKMSQYGLTRIYWQTH